MLPGDEIETEKQGLCPSYCNVKPFDASFAPCNLSCPYTDVGIDSALIPPSPLILRTMFHTTDLGQR